MARVKPLYLSRTYGVPLPDPDNPSRGWDAEQFLDALARMKGRLLKKGEPDVDGVAKIILTDWVRGRIPFFVAPPERPEELNKAEAKMKARGKGKAKVEEGEGEKEVAGVKQNLRSIMQKNTFLAEDVRPLDDEDEGDEDAVSDEGSDNDGDDGKESASEEAADAGDDELSWNDVFQEAGHPIASGNVSSEAPKSAKGMASCASIGIISPCGRGRVFR
jgi:nuclear GTP-binding protein